MAIVFSSLINLVFRTSKAYLYSYSKYDSSVVDKNQPQIWYIEEKLARDVLTRFL
jgi:hypothetical protein